MRLILAALLALLPASSAGASWTWTDNGDGTQTIAETRTEKQIVLSAAYRVFGLHAVTCDQALVDRGSCLSEDIGALVPNVLRQPCADQDVSSGRCTDTVGSWYPDVTKCSVGDEDLCKQKWINKGWYVPALGHSKTLAKRWAKDRVNTSIVGPDGGEARILSQGNEPREEVSD